MKLRTFEGKTMAEALAKVKRQYGRDAVILNTRTCTKGGMFGIGGRPWVEITAAPHMSELPTALRRGTVEMKSGRTGRAEGAAKAVSPTSSAQTPAHPQVDALMTELGDLKSLVTGLVRQTRRQSSGDLPDHLYDQYVALLQGAVAEEIAAGLIDDLRQRLSDAELRDPAVVRRQLAEALCSMLPLGGPIRLGMRSEPTIIALVGATGVGKTTTIAKLAANFCLRENRKVGLITIDTYRIAAVEQLKTYAQIIDVPLEVAMSPRQLAESIGRMGDRDLILIDTAGRSQRDSLKIKELRGFFETVRPHELHLVLSSTCSEAVLHETIDRFREFSIDRVIFTKMDEALGFGVIVNCLKSADAKLSYVTTGQDVPDDIEVPGRERLTSLILGEGVAKCGALSSIPAAV